MRRYFKMCAYIGSEYFDMRKYFEVCAYILMEANIFCVNYYLGKRQYFNDFVVSSTQLFSQ
jgi:hypothetical protein